jgi:hypothetical protein
VKLEEIAGVIITVLQEAGLSFMVVGGLSSNVYSIPRSTKDVDIVIRLEAPDQLRQIEELGAGNLRWVGTERPVRENLREGAIRSVSMRMANRPWD